MTILGDTNRFSTLKENFDKAANDRQREAVIQQLRTETTSMGYKTMTSCPHYGDLHLGMLLGALGHPKLQLIFLGTLIEYYEQRVETQRPELKRHNTRNAIARLDAIMKGMLIAPPGA